MAVRAGSGDTVVEPRVGDLEEARDVRAVHV
jgi:hypothetical protein